MARQSKILLGKITRVHGFEGAVTVKIEDNFSEKLPEMESVFLEIEGNPVPFFIEYLEYINPDIIRMKFEDYDNVSKVREFTGCNVFLPLPADFRNNTVETTDLSGYKLISDRNNRIGIVEGIIKNPGQWLFNVKAVKGEYILIPVHEDLIFEINHKNKVIKMTIPEGLTDINRK
jgi:16S rRNA processing protein RimM